MAINFVCSECDEDVKVKDELAGRKIKCPRCGSPTRVPGLEEQAEPSRPAKKSRPADDEDDGDDRPRKRGKKSKKPKKSNTVLVIGLAAGVGVLLLGGVVGVVLSLPKTPAPQAKGPPPVVPDVKPVEKQEPVKPDLNKVDIGKEKRHVTSIRARIERPERMNELKQLATFYQTFRSERGKPPQKAEEFIKYIERDSPPIKKAIEERYYVVVSKVTSGIIAYEHDPDNTGRHGTVDLSTAVDNISTEELVTQLKKQGSWSDDGNRPRK